jgi:hypothetical protein
MQGCRLELQASENDFASDPGANLYTFDYSKSISAIMFVAVLTGLQSVITVPVQAGTTCRLHLRTADANGAGHRTRAAEAERCLARAGRTALARNRAPFRDAHAEAGETAARAEVGDAAAHDGLGETLTDVEATARAEVVEANLPVATRCVAAPGRPIRRGPWELGIDRTTGRRCWGLAGAIKPHARMSSSTRASFKPKSWRVPKSSALPQRVAAASAGPATAPASTEAHRPSQPSEVRTGSVARLSEVQQVHLGQSPGAPVAGAISEPAEANGGELPLFDSRFAGASDWSLAATSPAPATTDIDPATPPSANMLDDVVAFMLLHGRPDIFLIVFLSMLALISTFYALVIGSLKLVRSRSRGERARAIRVMPQRYLGARQDGMS